MTDHWWRNKCTLYADRIRRGVPSRAGKSRDQILDCVITLEKAGKLMNDLDAHQVLQELDERLYTGNYTKKASTLIKKEIL